jgi:hypothetical protein
MGAMHRRHGETHFSVLLSYCQTFPTVAVVLVFRKTRLLTRTLTEQTTVAYCRLVGLVSRNTNQSKE